MRATDVIQKKRGTFITQHDGSRVLSSNTELSREEIKFLVDGYVKGEIRLSSVGIADGNLF